MDTRQVKYAPFLETVSRHANWDDTVQRLIDDFNLESSTDTSISNKYIQYIPPFDKQTQTQL